MSEKESSDHYNPGHCNIGAKELSVRKKFLKLFIPLSVFLSAAGLMWPANVAIWIFLILCTFSSIVLVTEIRYRFCILFGFFGLYNFKQLGHLDEVKNPVHLKMDRKKVWEIVILSLFIAVIYATIVHMVALMTNNAV
jgi:hypothetical protein